MDLLLLGCCSGKAAEAGGSSKSMTSLLRWRTLCYCIGITPWCSNWQGGCRCHVSCAIISNCHQQLANGICCCQRQQSNHLL